jgi:hypothetical protein
MAEQRYKVVGPFTTHGVAPGLVFEADFAPAHAARLIEQGAIEETTNQVTFDGEVELGELERPVPERPEGPGPSAPRQFHTEAKTTTKKTAKTETKE